MLIDNRPPYQVNFIEISDWVLANKQATLYYIYDQANLDQVFFLYFQHISPTPTQCDLGAIQSKLGVLNVTLKF